MDEKIVGFRLKLLREKKNLSQYKLAMEMAMSQPVITKYEMGAIFPSYPVLIRLADFFNVSTDYLLGRTDHPEGKLYEQPLPTKEEKIDDFIEMCFEPNTVANLKLKQALKKLMEESDA
jgi:transcriptional regulator with XRE-family HTH domain